ncbi:MAG: FtsX-like permease family protein [Gammaproteobacteria bacterium]|nr:MAG: FtsX-like permease family protein [Gammaproteobacteria bacterium]
MRLLDCNRLAGGALLRAPARTFMMLLATAIGVAAVVVLTSLGEAARRFVTDEFRSLGTNLIIVLPGRSETSGLGPGMVIAATPRDLTLDDARALQRSPYIRRLAPVVVGEVSVSRGGLEREVTLLGTTPEFRVIRQWHMAMGEFLPNVGLEQAAPLCVLGATVSNELFRRESPLGRWLRVGDRRCRVSGVLEPQGRSIGVDVDEVVIVPVVTAQQLFDSPGLFRIIAQAKGRAAIEAAKRDARRIITARHYGEEDITVITQDAVLATFDGIFGNLTRALAGIASISLVVAGVLIMNVMLIAVSQRTSEVGLLKALGATRRQIIALFLTEAIFLAGLGACVGIIFGYLIDALLVLFYPDLDFRPPSWAVLGAVLTAVAAGTFFGILPARRAAELDPIAALAGR